jgi:hypothetical protein
MGAMFFGQYLLSKGVIDREALIDAIERQRRANVSLPELARRRGLLEPAQVAAIMIRYRTSEASFEDLCLEHLDQMTVDELVETQRSDWVRIGAALVAGGHLTRPEVEERLEEFRAVQRDSEQQLQADFQACRDPETVQTVVELSVFHLGRFTNLPIKLASLSPHNGQLQPGHRRYGLKLVGDRELHIALDMPTELAELVAEGLVGMPLEGESEAGIDAVCECVNIIGGNACTRLEAAGCRLRPEPPFSTNQPDPADAHKEAVCAHVLAGEMGFDVQVFLW